MQKNMLFRTFCFNICAILLAVVYSPFLIINKNVVEARYCDDFYMNTGTLITTTITLDYDYYEVTQSVYTDLSLPAYDFYNQSNNTCAPTAGSIALGYYDFYFNDLIPNRDSYVLINGVYAPRYEDSTVTSVMGQLYTLMGTNVGGEGTTQAGFKNGMQSYIQTQGYSVQYTNMGSGTTMLSNCQTAFANNKACVLFLNSYQYVSYGAMIINDTNYSMVVKSKVAGHVCIAGGYLEYKFYSGSTVIETDRFLEISFGNGTTGFLFVNDTTLIDDAYSITIS